MHATVYVSNADEVHGLSQNSYEKSAPEALSRDLPRSPLPKQVLRGGKEKLSLKHCELESSSIGIESSLDSLPHPRLVSKARGLDTGVWTGFDSKASPLAPWEGHWPLPRAWEPNWPAERRRAEREGEAHGFGIR